MSEKKNPPQITKEKKKAILDGARQILEYAFPGAPGAAILEVLIGAAETVPACRSCNLCDFLVPAANGEERHHCRFWKSDPPDHILEEGCDELQDLGVPF